MGLKYGSRRDSNEEKDKQTLLETTWKIQVYSNVSKQRKRKEKEKHKKKKKKKSTVAIFIFATHPLTFRMQSTITFR